MIRRVPRRGARFCLVDESGRRSSGFVAGPKLPDGWTKQMEMMPIGPCAGSCGRRRIEIARHRFRYCNRSTLGRAGASCFGLRHGLRASWSSPILSSKGKGAGNFLCTIAHREVQTRMTSALSEGHSSARVAVERDALKKHSSLPSKWRADKSKH